MRPGRRPPLPSALAWRRLEERGKLVERLRVTVAVAVDHLLANERRDLIGHREGGRPLLVTEFPGEQGRRQKLVPGPHRVGVHDPRLGDDVHIAHLTAELEFTGCATPINRDASRSQLVSGVHLFLTLGNAPLGARCRVRIRAPHGVEGVREPLLETESVVDQFWFSHGVHAVMQAIQDQPVQAGPPELPVAGVPVLGRRSDAGYLDEVLKAGEVGGIQGV